MWKEEKKEKGKAKEEKSRKEKVAEKSPYLGMMDIPAGVMWLVSLVRAIKEGKFIDV